MKAVCLKQPRQFALIDIPEPDALGAGDALVRVHRVGICGTDISGYLGKFPFYSYPRIPGHELGVEVLAVGADVANVSPGDHCSVEPYINDPNSFASRRGRPNCCEQLRVLGVHTDGGLRPRFVLPARKLHPSASLTFEQLALVETLAIGRHAIQRAAPDVDEFVLVIGAGPIGLSVIEFARLAQVRLIVMDMNPARLDFCRRVMGVQHTVPFRGDGSELEILREITSGELPTVVLDATGNVASMNGAFQYIGHTGKMVLVGIVNDEIRFLHPAIHRAEITILASRNALPQDFRDIIAWIEQGRIDTRPWITHRTDCLGMVEQFESFTRPETGVIKAMVTVGE